MAWTAGCPNGTALRKARTTSSVASSSIGLLHVRNMNKLLMGMPCGCSTMSMCLGAGGYPCLRQRGKWTYPELSAVASRKWLSAHGRSL